MALISDIDSYDEGADVVVLMTMHAAKGLEFNYVFIVGLEEGIFPSEMSRYSNEDLEEERRLCYVGITRAKKELYLSCANSRMLFGQTKHNRPSRFLEEIDASLVEVEQSPAAAQTKAMRQRYMQQHALHGTGGIFGPLRRRFPRFWSGRRFTPCPAARFCGRRFFHGSGGQRGIRSANGGQRSLSSGRPGGA